ncbi:MAG: SLC13 family permease [Acidobacteria bacterium]|nr:SLC13 family permease [Acidobacteriota bacterium]MDA1236186.1 SLC13 family permease [Acidobacteriota bacterium]
MHPLIVLLIATIAVFLLIIRFKINAFVALILSAILIGILSRNIPLASVIPEVTSRFGDVVGRIGVAIAMAALIGHSLMESGAADRITRQFIRWLGEKYSSLSMLVSGYVLSIPVFHDTVFYLLIPLARAMTIRNGGKRYVLNALSIGAGGVATHLFVPPTPGPLAMAATMNLDIGLVMIVGLTIGIPSSLAAWLYAVWIDRKLNIPMREAPGASLAELEEIANRPESELPGFFVSMLPIALPVLLITGNTVANTFFSGTAFAQQMVFWGNANVALILSAACGLWVLARHKNMGLRDLAKPAEKAIKDAGLIIMITAGGGAFGGMLVAAGVADSLSQGASDMGISYLFLAFGVAMMLRVAQGSATVAMITVSQMLAPLITQSPLPYHPVYLLIATGGGAIMAGWMNDSGFWVYKTMTGLTEMEALKTKSVSLSVMGLTAFLFAWLGSIFFPMV